MARNRGENHKLVKKPAFPKPTHSPRDDIKHPKKSLPRPHKRKG